MHLIYKRYEHAGDHTQTTLETLVYNWLMLLLAETTTIVIMSILQLLHCKNKELALILPTNRHYKLVAVLMRVVAAVLLM